MGGCRWTMANQAIPVPKRSNAIMAIKPWNLDNLNTVQSLPGSLNLYASQQYTTVCRSSYSTFHHRIMSALCASDAQRRSSAQAYRSLWEPHTKVVRAHN